MNVMDVPSVPGFSLQDMNFGFLVSMKSNPMAFAVLTSLDIFTIWVLILFSIGFANVARVSYLHRLGFVPSCLKADELLVAATAPDRPKGERLTAIDGLGRGGRPPAQRKLEFLANDADPEVARRARRALGQE